VNSGSANDGQQHTPAQGPADPPIDFERAVEQVEAIIERIESGEVGLEKSISEYERGVALIRRCRQILDRAEQRVEELTAQMQADAGASTPAPKPSPLVPPAASAPPPEDDPESPF
jgi:exodeoxyribonuclease VII small subunit